MNYVAKSLDPNFKNLDEKSKIETLIEDAKKSDGIDLNNLSETDKKKLKSIMIAINTTKDIEEIEKCINEYIDISKDHFDIYKILGMFLYGVCIKKLGISLFEFVKKFFIKHTISTVFNTEQVAAKSYNTINQNMNNYAINSTVNSRVSGSNIANVFTEGGKYDPINNSNIIIEQHNHECDNPNCSCGNQHNTTGALRDPVSKYPEWDINKKAEYIKKKIEFIPGKNILHEYQLDNLIYLVEGVHLRNKLLEYKASNKLLKETVLSNTDNPVYDFKFYTESDIDGKVIVVLYNSDSHKNQTYLEVRLEDARK